MKKTGGIIWGLVLIAIGLVLSLNALNITDINVFFDGWWTLFIIVPCGIGLFTERDKAGNLIGLGIGVLLLLCAQDILSFSMVWKLIVPAVIIVIGIKLICGGLFANKAHKVAAQTASTGVKPRVGCAVFSGCDMIVDGEFFEGAELTAVFGGVKCDLRNAILDHDCTIRVCAIFGGIDILMPQNVNVRVSSTSVFGGISNKTGNANNNGVTVYVSGTCLFGGVDIK